ncbi:MAG TPA: ATP-binding protein [Bryobacteraceae bacterium]|nr:ATP-binding protein [Bryobacteraceae bacterium]
MSLPRQSNTRRRLALLFCVPLVVSFVFLILDLQTEHTDLLLSRTRDLSSSVGRLASLARDAESGERGYLLYGDERYLIPLQQANSELATDIDSCLRNVKDVPKFQRPLEEVIRLVKNRVSQANQVVKTEQATGLSAAVDLAKTDTADSTMNQLRRAVDDLTRNLSDESSRYRSSEHQLGHGAFFSFLIGTLLMIGVLMWLYRELLSYLHQRDVAYENLESANAELDARVRERTRDLTEANQELAQFAYVASHDLQEPLRTITSFTQLIESRYKGRLDDDADEFLGYIVSSSRRMTDLINGLLTLVRLRKAGQPTAPVSFEELLEEAEASLQASIRDNDAIIEHGALPALVADKVQFSQVFQNLLSNAIKYRRDEQPLIRVQAKRDSSNWVFSVADNGRGFNQQFAERIFGLFQRLHGRDVEGTGIGLSIARKIVERHGGRIWADSEEGVGSTFYFSLPVSLEVSRAAPDEKPAAMAAP